MTHPSGGAEEAGQRFVTVAEQNRAEETAGAAAPAESPTRLAVTSDLHWEVMRSPAERHLLIDELAAAIARADPQVVLLAGDVGNGPVSVAQALRHLAERLGASTSPRPLLLYIPGNHDVWITDREREARISTSFDAVEALADACEATGWRLLPGSPVQLGGVAIVGSSGWYDIHSGRSPSVPASIDAYRDYAWMGTRVQDGEFVRWVRHGRRLFDEEVAEIHLEQIAADLDRVGADRVGSGPITVAATHILPYREMVRYRGPSDAAWDFASAYFVHAAIGELYDGRPRVQGVIAGHTHTPFAVRDGLGREIVVSPLGYAGGLEFPAQIGDRVTILEADERGVRRPAWADESKVDL